MAYQKNECEISLESGLVKRLVSRQTERGINYGAWEIQRMPRIPDDLLHCSVYLYPSIEQARTGERLGGSGFIVGIPMEEVPAMARHIYVVTNSHVVQKSKVLRLNTVDGAVEFIDTKDMPWKYSEDADVAILWLDLDDKKFRVMHIPTTIFLKRSDITPKGIGIGDDCIIIGRFINHEGRQQNRPSARAGIISVMPDKMDGIQNEHMTKAIESYLVEVYSIPGYSGSPVILNIPSVGRVRPGVAPVAGNRITGLHFLGIDWGHIYNSTKVMKNGKPTDMRVEVSTGMMCVSPSWHILDLINSEDVAEERRLVDESEKAPAPITVLDSAGAIDAKAGDKLLGKMLATPPKTNARRVKKKPAKKSA